MHIRRIYHYKFMVIQNTVLLEKVNLVSALTTIIFICSSKNSSDKECVLCAVDCKDIINSLRCILGNIILQNSKCTA
jgi:hypothetical protein